MGPVPVVLACSTQSPEGAQLPTKLVRQAGALQPAGIPVLDVLPPAPDVLPPAPDVLPSGPDVLPPAPDVLPSVPDELPPQPATTRIPNVMIETRFFIFCPFLLGDTCEDPLDPTSRQHYRSVDAGRRCLYSSEKWGLQDASVSIHVASNRRVRYRP